MVYYHNTRNLRTIDDFANIVGKLLSDAGLTLRMAGRAIDADAEPLDAARESYLWVHSRFENESPTRRRSRSEKRRQKPPISP